MGVGHRWSIVGCGSKVRLATRLWLSRTVVSAQVAPVYVILLTCKAYDLDAAVDAIAPAMAPTGFVLPLLDGVAHIELLNHRFGQDRVLGGTAKIQTMLTSDGQSHFLASLGKSGACPIVEPALFTGARV